MLRVESIACFVVMHDVCIKAAHLINNVIIFDE